MTEQQDILHRANDGIIAGVCSGLAQRWGIDTGVLRFAFIALTIATLGTFALVYVALWLVLPSQEQVRRLVDVDPDFVASDIYGVRDSRRNCGRKREKTHVDYSHTPPQPPDAAVAAAAMRMQSAEQTRQSQSFFLIAMGLGLGTLLVVTGVACFVSSFAPVFSPLQFWPLIVIALGIMRMVLPGEHGYCIESFMFGFVLFCLGAVLLASTTGVYFMHFDIWFMQGWPILALATGCFLLWKGTFLSGFILCVMVLVTVFCLVGVAFCSDPGPALPTLVELPFVKGFPVMVVG